MKVLFIAGAGRSGSTLLGLILGNLPGYFSVGEVYRLWDYYPLDNVLCGCGELLRDCPVWSRILVEAGFDTIEKIIKVQQLSRELDRTRKLLHLKAGLYSKADFRSLVTANQRFYQAIYEVTGAEVVVDTSKVPSHLFFLSQIPDLEVRVLHLIRDGRAVAHAWNKHVKQEISITDKEAYMPQRSSALSLMRWAAENVFATSFSKGLPDTSLMRYEDFSCDPYNELSRVLDELNLTQANLQFLRKDEIILQNTHSVGGNPVRFKTQSIRIKLDESWKEHLSGQQFLIQGLLVAPVLRKYGYSISSPQIYSTMC